jgi:hypothetical protein
MSDKLHNEYMSVVMSSELLKFCRVHDLPFESADELVMREGISDFQFGWLIAYVSLWDSLIDGL